MPKTVQNLAALRQEFFKMAEAAVSSSGGRLRLAFREEDDNDKPQREAAHFLKLDGKRLGRDIEVYQFMLVVMTPEDALPFLLEEILYPIAKILPESWKNAGEVLRQMGVSVLDEQLIVHWNALFD